MTSPDHIALLRAAGEDRAADMLTALKPAEAAERETPETPAPSSTPAVAAMSPAEGQREQEGRAVLAQLYRSCPQFMPDAETTT